jgi:hypothetical protein
LATVSHYGRPWATGPTRPLRLCLAPEAQRKLFSTAISLTLYTVPLHFPSLFSLTFCTQYLMLYPSTRAPRIFLYSTHSPTLSLHHSSKILSWQQNTVMVWWRDWLLPIVDIDWGRLTLQH